MYILMYIEGMTVTITEFRNNIFKMVERALAGESVEFVYQGSTIRLSPQIRPSRLDRLTPRQITNPEVTEEAERNLQAEMMLEMERDWADI